MNKERMKAQLRELYGDMAGVVRLHWSGDDTVPCQFLSLDSALDEIAERAVYTNMSAGEIEKIAYIVTEAEYQEQQREFDAINAPIERLDS